MAGINLHEREIKWDVIVEDCVENLTDFWNLLVYIISSGDYTFTSNIKPVQNAKISAPDKNSVEEVFDYISR